MFGVLDPLRGWLGGNALYLASGDSSIAAIAGLPQWAAWLSLAFLCLGGILFLGHAWDHPGLIGAGVLIGLAVVAGWWVTGVLGYDEFTERPPTSLAVAGPLARATAWVTMHQPTGSLFALLFIPGVLAGSLASTLLSRSFRWISPDGSRIGAYLGGGALMGVGAVLAGGCNLGQGDHRRSNNLRRLPTRRLRHLGRNAAGSLEHEQDGWMSQILWGERIPNPWIYHPRYGSWTPPRVRARRCLARRNEAEWPAIATSCNAARHRPARALGGVAASPES